MPGWEIDACGGKTVASSVADSPDSVTVFFESLIDRVAVFPAALVATTVCAHEEFTVSLAIFKRLMGAIGVELDDGLNALC